MIGAFYDITYNKLTICDILDISVLWKGVLYLETGLKIFVFVVALILINYIGGVPHDSKNLFISHLVFFAPILLEYHKLLRIKTTLLKSLIVVIFVAGLLALVTNTLGVLEILIVNKDHQIVRNPDYLLIWFDISIIGYTIIAGLTYAAVFGLNLISNAIISLDKRLVKARKEQLKVKQGKEKREELVSDVSG